MDFFVEVEKFRRIAKAVKFGAEHYKDFCIDLKSLGIAETEQLQSGFCWQLQQAEHISS